ncbi:DUF4291 domain-containing protein [Brevifollis gellanilyticus]|uniref:DUF4291 domain-containing protein n=1 Tax=Brevifollis gellanilyticus TaxID=748831 RepID=A0A512MAT4_9BACT|nr:DUF4291 domain-containing protein [Brevifollis gellanilyticus]GEP43840.1 hypothetical protein BGE01nite_31310 [Brevifollis gellanilyticus]
MTLSIQSYLNQQTRWPTSGKHILAQFDDTSIIVYQAYRPAIAQYAVENKRFGGEFSFNRMSWIKPNFLWMMYRSGWAAKESQERILAVRIPRTLFDDLLLTSVASSFGASGLTTHEEWQAAVERSEVRLQWDPDHSPRGGPLARRAVQLGLRGEMLRRYAETELLGIEDITDFVITQRQHLSGDLSDLQTPTEYVYQPSNPAVAAAVNLDP